MDKLSFETLESMLAEAIQLVQPGSHWRHYKGNDYRVEQLVIQESDNQVAVVYTPLKHLDTSFVRPLEAWLARVPSGDDTAQRFTRID